VAGPPCGGKTTYARAQLQAGESLLDFDDIVEELGSERYAGAVVGAQAYRLWLDRLPSSDVVVWTAPKRTQRGRFRSEFGAQVVVLLPSMDECLRRARAQRPASWQAEIRRWYLEWEPSRSGRETVIHSVRAL
jgi:predicted kinase